MKFKIDIPYIHLLLYLYIILEAEAARPFNSGNTRSNFGSDTRNYGRTNSVGSGIGNTRNNFGSGSRTSGSTNSIGSSTRTTNVGYNPTAYNNFISIADAKAGLLSGSKTAQTSSPTNYRFSSLHRQPQNNPTILKSQSNVPIISIADAKKNLGSGAQLPTVPNYAATAPTKHLPLNTALKTQVPATEDVSSLSKQPAYNPFFNFGTNVGPNLTTTNVDLNSQPKQPPYNPFFPGMNTTPNFPVDNFGLNQPQMPNPTSKINKSILHKMLTTNLNDNKTSKVVNSNFTKNSTNITNSNFSTTPIDYINSFPHFKLLNLEHDKIVKDNKGYTVGAVQQSKRIKTEQELNKIHKKPVSNHVKNQIIVIVTLVIVIALVVGIIIFLKVKK